MNLSLDDAKSLYELAKSSYSTFQAFRDELDRAEELARVRSKIAWAVGVGHLFAVVDILYDSTVLQLQVDGFSIEYDPAANVDHPSPVKISGWA
jgi:hypothetical protein